MAKKKSKKKVIVISSVVAALVLLFILMFVIGGKGKVVEVTTAKVTRRTLVQKVSAIGKIEAEKEVKISPQVSGEISDLKVKEGDTVKANQLLVKIKPDIIETQLEQNKAAVDAAKTDIESMKAEMERAKNDLKRKTELYKKEFISQEDFDRVKATYEQAQSNYKSYIAKYSQAKAYYKQTQRSAARTTIYSPINGIVTKCDVEQGEKVVGTDMMQGTEMMRVSDLTVMNAVVDVDENDIVMVQIGDTASVEIDAIPDKKYKAVVVEIGHSAQTSASGTQEEVINFKVKVRILDVEPRLRPGMSCNVDITTDIKNNVLSLPLSSVTVKENKNMMANSDEQKKISEADEKMQKLQKNQKPTQIVYLKQGNIVKACPVKTGVSDKEYIEITEGLKEGDEVVSGSYFAIQKELSDGVSIKVNNNPSPGKTNGK